MEKRKEFFKALFAAAPDPVVVADETGRILTVNRQTETTFGYTTSELVGKSVDVLLPHDLRAIHSAHRAGFMASRSQRTVPVMARDLTAMRKDGALFPVGVSLSVVEDPPFQFLIAAIRDISERKNEEVFLAQAHSLIAESIRYAARIQRALLPGQDLLSTLLPDHLVLWEPRDMVGGDMYWVKVWGDGLLILLADCTGHGVPGAFMTLLSSGTLDRALGETVVGDVGGLLGRMHQLIQITLGQRVARGESNDGLEAAACYLNADLTSLGFAGARMGLFLSEGREIREIRGTGCGMGNRGIPERQRYENHRFDLRPGNRFYLTTDGLIDQVGGERHRMFGKRRFMALLGDIADLPMAEQKARIRDALRDFQGSETRRDDIAVIGFRVG